jgi:hypothetical protein
MKYAIVALAALALFASEAQAGHGHRVVVQRVVVQRPHVQQVVVQRQRVQRVVVQQVHGYHAQQFVQPVYSQQFSAGHCQQQFVAPVYSQQFNAGHNCGALLQFRSY